LDGRAFSTYTRTLSKPFDVSFQGAMDVGAAEVAQEFVAQLVYVASDEISVIFRTRRPEASLPFGGVVAMTLSLAGEYGDRLVQHCSRSHGHGDFRCPCGQRRRHR